MSLYPVILPVLTVAVNIMMIHKEVFVNLLKSLKRAQGRFLMSGYTSDVLSEYDKE